jgi:hypothetical protein
MSHILELEEESKIGLDIILSQTRKSEKKGKSQDYLDKKNVIKNFKKNALK